MRKWLILVFVVATSTVSGAPAWTWVDAEGQVHFSDRPVPGARQVELTGAQGFGTSAPARAPSTAPAVTPPAVAQAPYRSITIVSPTEQQTLWNIGGTLPVQVQLDPALQAGHRLDLALDGQRRNLNTARLSLSVGDVFRGAHTLQVIVIDSAGAEVMRSPSRNFVVQQTSVQNPNSIPGRRPAANAAN